jgi:hypothetical protein
MAIDYGNDINLGDVNELQNALIQNLAVDPASAPMGKIIYNTALKMLKIGNGASFDSFIYGLGVTGPLATTGGKNPTLSMPAATTTVDGYMTKALVSAINANTVKVTNATHTGDVTGSGALTIAAKAVTLAKMADLTSNTIIGNNTGSAAAPMALSPAQVRSLINVSDGANNYSHPIGDGNNHVPMVGTTNTGKFLKATGNETMAWALLDALDISDFEVAVGNHLDVAANTAARHGHDNKTILDNTTASYTTTEQSKLAALSSADQHVQNTDTGTIHEFFSIGGPNGIALRVDNSEVLTLRNQTNDSYMDLRVRNLYIEGPTTTVASTVVELGDNIIELNKGVTSAATNSDGGIDIKRVSDDQGTRADAILKHSESRGVWTSTRIRPDNTAVEFSIANKVHFIIGDGVATSFVLTHNLNTRAVVVSISQTISPYGEILTRVEKTSLDTITIKFKTAPAAGAYEVTIIG